MYGSASRVILLISGILIGFYMMPFLVHNLGNEYYGLWILASSVVAFYSLIDFGLSFAMQRYLIQAIHGEDTEEVNATLSTSITLTAGFSILAIIISFVIFWISPFFMEDSLHQELFGLLILIMGFKAAFQITLFPFYGVLVAHYNYTSISYTQLFMLLARTFLIIVFIENGYDLIAMAIILFVTDLFGSVLIAYKAFKIQPGLKVDIKLFSRSKLLVYINYGKYVFFIESGDRVKLSIDDIIIASLISVGAVTHYTIAHTLVSYLTSFSDSILGVLTPVFNRYHKLEQWGEMRTTFSAMSDISAYLSILLGGGLIVFGYDFIQLWMGSEYLDTYPALAILCTTEIIVKSQTPVVISLFATARHKYLAALVGVETLVNLIISIALAPYLGITGVALGTAIPAIIVYLIFLPPYACKIIGVSVKRYYLSLFKFMSLSFLVFLMAGLMNKYYPSTTYIELLIKSFFVFVVYSLFSFRFIVSFQTKLFLNGYISQNYRQAWVLLSGFKH
ncbi:MAG: oligosaccharide flippase family protein [Gammaproteobacteria bacterium]|nr:oligosaccharide flippase family protein [Gammaproteobacteria bacterium]